MEGEITLTQRADEYIELRGKLKTLNATIKEREESAPQYNEIESLSQRLKDLKAARNLADGELDKLKEMKSEYQAEAEALLMVIGQGIKSENPTMIEGIDAPAIEHKGYKFILRDKLVVQKEK